MSKGPRDQFLRWPGAVLGIDAAWTLKNPSGVALLSASGELISVAPSYKAFLEVANGLKLNWCQPTEAGGTIDAVIRATTKMNDTYPVSVVAVDMPVSKVEIVRRRICDQAVSQEFGGNGCSTHSPNRERPGPTSEAFSRAMLSAGYNLATTQVLDGKSYIEVYPHTALLRIMKADYRVPYKAGNRSRYWPDLSTAARKEALLEQWKEIVAALEKKVGKIDIPINDGVNLKAVEDAIDAIICAWVGYEYANGRAACLGDEDAAIWTPV
jgi:predicted RNase H-like nuclease